VKVGWWLVSYIVATPGVEAADNTTVRLDLENESQPDVILFVDPKRGGQAKVTADGYIEGAPELVLEVSSSIVSIDLHEKLRVYRRNQVREYVVWRVLDRAIDWFILRHGEYVKLAPNAAGLYQSEIFAGLWLDAAALIAADLGRVLAALQQGLATPEHAAFAAKLAAAVPGPADQAAPEAR
jgi:Uma2 family endonuclease